MSIKRQLKTLVQNRAETSENHEDEQLKTRYYKGMKDGVMKELETIIRQTKGLELVSTGLERGEMIVNVHKGKKALMVITIINVKPLKTAVDFSVSTHTSLPTDFGFSKKMILSMYERIDQTLRFIGKGIGNQI